MTDLALELRRLQIDLAVRRVIPGELLARRPHLDHWDIILANSFGDRVDREFKKIAKQSPIFTAREIFDAGAHGEAEREVAHS
jgi:hypothetical protein